MLLIVGERANHSGEARSRAILDLPGSQNELIEALASAGKPVVLIVQAGRPLTIGKQVSQVDAVPLFIPRRIYDGTGSRRSSLRQSIPFRKTASHVPQVCRSAAPVLQPCQHRPTSAAL